MYVAKQVGQSGKVIAVEMIPENYVVLKKNLSENFPDNTIAINCGVHKETGNRTAYLGNNQIAGFRKEVIARYVTDIHEIEIEMDTVDNIQKNQDIGVVNLMIIQVNGNEIDVLQGVTKSIKNIKNFAVAAPYDRPGMDHKQVLKEFFSHHWFNVEVKPPWVFANVNP
jgi:FkbM family methyltransferase